MKNYFRNNDIHIKMIQVDEEILAQHTVDFVSFSYYMTMVKSVHEEHMEKVGGNSTTSVKNPYLETSEGRWQVDPISLRIALIDVCDRYHKPVFIVKVGLAPKMN